MIRSARDQLCHQSYTPTPTTTTTSTTTPITTNHISPNHDHNENLSRSGRQNQKKNNKQNNHLTRFMKPSQILFHLFLVYTIFSHSKTPKPSTTSSLSSSLLSLLSRNHINHPHRNQYYKHYHSHAKTSQIESHGEFFLYAEATSASECENDTDCDGNGEKICHENKCMCNKDRPIESGGYCLPLQFIDEPCQVDGQCLGGSQCIDGTCSCGLDGIRIKNPSQGIFYCHPKRVLNEQCNYDIQCPANAYCSNECLCQNGYAPANIKTSPEGPEISSCLPITCSDVSQCESSEFYQCEENKCKCIPTHFDPTRAKCYRLGSLQLGNLTDENASSGNNKTLDDITMENSNNNNRILLILNDLIDSTTGRADLFWLLVAVIFLTLVLLIALCCGYCCFKRDNGDGDANGRPNHHRSWLYFMLPCCFIGGKHHQEWGPADAKAAPPDGDAFLHKDNRKNNVNQKSFRRKKNLDSNADSADEFDDVLDPKSSLVKNNNDAADVSLTSKNNDYQVIYFGDQKCKVPRTVAEEPNQTKSKSSIDSEDRQFRIDIMNGVKADGAATKMSNGLSTDKSHLFQNGTQNKLTNHKNDQQLDHVIVPTNSTLV